MLHRCRLAAAALVLAATPAAATPVNLAGDVAHSTSGLGNFQGTLTYTPSSSTAATLVLALTNTSPLANGGFLTAFVLNNPGDHITGAALTATDPDFKLLFGNDDLNGAPFGRFDVGTSTGDSFEGGGAPSRGLAVGATATFTFALTGTGLDALTEQSFVSTPSTGTGAGGGYEFFAARFRGFNDGGSDKVPADANGGAGTPVTPTPAPASLVLLGLGAFAAGAYLGLRRRPQPAPAPVRKWAARTGRAPAPGRART